jgi:hypothetical protein
MSDLPNLWNDDGAPDGQRPVSARRRLLRIGAGTAPVVLTLLSRPVLGAQCLTTSAIGSTITSLTHQASVCSGLTVSSWIASTSWPDPYKKTTKNGINGWDATFYHCLTTGLNGTTFTGKTMLNVMNLTDDGSVRSLGRYIAAALLNARSGRTPVLSETTVRGMWNAYLAAGYYEPTAGVHWGPSQMVAYIQSTMG